MTAPRPTRLRTLLPLLSALILLGGCGTEGRSSAAKSAAAAFEQGVRDKNAATLCASFAPGTRSELESDEQSPCSEAVAKVALPTGGSVRTVDVYGRQARVVLDADTLFLSQFPGGWKVVAAGCTPRHEKPYSCVIKGA